LLLEKSILKTLYVSAETVMSWMPPNVIVNSPVMLTFGFGYWSRRISSHFQENIFAEQGRLLESSK
jgi:hypothetical protein